MKRVITADQISGDGRPAAIVTGHSEIILGAKKIQGH